MVNVGTVNIPYMDPMGYERLYLKNPFRGPIILSHKHILSLVAPTLFGKEATKMCG